MNDTELNRLADLIQARLSGQTGTPALPRPKELDDPNTDPTLRAAILEAYTGKINDRPASTWSPSERHAVNEQVARVLRDMGQ